MLLVGTFCTCSIEIEEWPEYKTDHLLTRSPSNQAWILIGYLKHKVSAHNATTVPHFCFVPSCKRFTELFSFSVGRARTDDRSSQHSDDQPAPVLIS